MKKKLSALVACLTLVVLASNSAMASFNLTPTSGLKLHEGPETSNAAITAWLKTNGYTQPEIYKSNVGEDEEGDGAPYYDTTYFNSPSDPSDALIEWVVGQTKIVASHLVVKDGFQSPGWYLFDISAWDGMEDIKLTGFWPQQGAISHISIYGSLTAVPEPTSIGLFLLGMGCVTGGSFIRRRRA